MNKLRLHVFTYKGLKNNKEKYVVVIATSKKQATQKAKKRIKSVKYKGKIDSFYGVSGCAKGFEDMFNFTNKRVPLE